MTTQRPSKPYPEELRERAVRLVQEHEAEYASPSVAIRSVAAKVGCHAETLRGWVRLAEREAGQQEGLNAAERERIRALERENRELRPWGLWGPAPHKPANEILRKASAYFAQAELDRRSKP